MRFSNEIVHRRHQLFNLSSPDNQTSKEDNYSVNKYNKRGNKVKQIVQFELTKCPANFLRSCFDCGCIILYITFNIYCFREIFIFWVFSLFSLPVSATGFEPTFTELWACVRPLNHLAMVILTLCFCNKLALFRSMIECRIATNLERKTAF